MLIGSFRKVVFWLLFGFSFVCAFDMSAMTKPGGGQPCDGVCCTPGTGDPKSICHVVTISCSWACQKICSNNGRLVICDRVHYTLPVCLPAGGSSFTCSTADFQACTGASPGVRSPCDSPRCDEYTFESFCRSEQGP